MNTAIFDGLVNLLVKIQVTYGISVKRQGCRFGCVDAALNLAVNALKQRTCTFSSLLIQGPIWMKRSTCAKISSDQFTTISTYGSKKMETAHLAMRIRGQ